MSILPGSKYKIILTGILLLLLTLLTASIKSSSMVAYAKDAQEGLAKLRYMPHGSVYLEWQRETKQLKVTITLTGLAPNSTHPGHLHKGACEDEGPVLYKLNNVNANAAGNASTTTIIHDVETGIPSKSWYINVRNGPMLKTETEYIPVACGNINNVDTGSRSLQAVHAHLSRTSTPDQSAHGIATLELDDDELQVKVQVYNLVPGSRHAVNLYKGSCEQQQSGSLIYNLRPLVANRDGTAITETMLEDIQFFKNIPESGWYINIHRSEDLSTQTGYDPIACGNVKQA